MNHAGDATIPIHPSAFAWRNIGCSVATRGKAEVLLLDAIWGCLGPSEMLAIIGELAERREKTPDQDLDAIIMYWVLEE